MHCQIETLRRCFPPSIRQILDGLPRTLDETYERILLEIDEEKQVYANRLFQCLAMSIRPLRAEELAEIFAVLPNAGSTPDFDASWRPDDPEAFILSACSTLVTIVDPKARYEATTKRTVQFSHFSVKEYLTSDRIANSAPVSHFQVLPKPAHTLLAGACLGVLLQLDDSIEETRIKNLPLAQYAAEHWVGHARFEDVSSDIKDAMDRLFDKDRSHLAAWLSVYNLDDEFNVYYDGDDDTIQPGQLDAVPLYYAALCGFHGLVERLLGAHPEDLDAKGGVRGTPLGAALGQGHLNIALLLLEHGANGEEYGRARQTGLYIASSLGYAEIVRTLVNRGANLNAVCECHWDEPFGGVEFTPLHEASLCGELEVARVLLEYGANVNDLDNFGRSPLHLAVIGRSVTDPDGSADPSASNVGNETLLHHPSYSGYPGVIKLLIDHGSDINSQRAWRYNPFSVQQSSVYGYGWTPLHYAMAGASVEGTQLLLDHGADVNKPDGDHWTALHLAAYYGDLKQVNILLGRGANPQARTVDGDTTFGVIKRCPSWRSSPHHPQIMQLLSEHTGESVGSIIMGVT